MMCHHVHDEELMDPSGGPLRYSMALAFRVATTASRWAASQGIATAGATKSLQLVPENRALVILACLDMHGPKNAQLIVKRSVNDV